MKSLIYFFFPNKWMNILKVQSQKYCKRVQAPLALDKIDEVSLSGKPAVYMLIASRLPCREQIRCRVSVECLLVPVKCSRDSTNDVRGMLCRKYKSLDQAYVFLGQNPFWFTINPQADVPLLILTPRSPRAAPWLQKSRVGKTSSAKFKATHTWFQGLCGFRHRCVSGDMSVPALFSYTKYYVHDKQRTILLFPLLATELTTLES